MKKLWASSVLVVAAATLVSGCTIVDKSTPTSTEAATSASTPALDAYPSAISAIDTSLTVTRLTGNSMEVGTRHLFCAGSTAVAGTDFPGANAACAVVQASGKLLDSEPVPNDDDKCTGTGNQNIADVFGESHGKHIRVSFMRNNLCNVQTWDKLTPLIGLGA
ncbi:hypothetical protein ACQCSX_08860 [Pseudarthrobacter sp. P1]|uniref:hypothetical protein n=1 Tax=Pseudarthrobacter sp. P1 TaxID=3418418 RepID=UPI003CFA1483